MKTQDPAHITNTPTEKVCKQCRTFKPVTEFYKYKTIGYVSTTCKPCVLKQKHQKVLDRLAETGKVCLCCHKKKKLEAFYFNAKIRLKCAECFLNDIKKTPKKQKSPFAQKMTFEKMALKALNKQRWRLKKMNQPNWYVVLEVYANGVKTYLQRFSDIDLTTVIEFNAIGQVENVYKYRLEDLWHTDDLISVMCVYLNK